MRWSGILAGAMALICAGSAMAGALDDAFGSGPACYARAYDQTHLASHPKQRVREVMLGTLPEETAEDPGEWDIVLDLGFTLIDGSDYAGRAYCVNDACSLEGDGGRFDIAPAKDDGLQLSIVGDFLELEGVEGFSGNLAESDDKVFLLYPVSASAC